MSMTAVSLFAGVGGIDLALERAGVRVTTAVEIDRAARGVLADRFPMTILRPDVTKVTGDELRADGFVPERGLLAAGFPCQDLSVAGKRAGLAGGSRSALYFHVVRLLFELRPRWVLLENVPGMLSSDGPDEEHRCVCGWPYRRRGLHLRSGQRAEGAESAVVLRGNRGRHDRQGAASPGVATEGVWGTHQPQPASYGEVERGARVERARVSGSSDAPEAGTVPAFEVGACAAGDSGRGDQAVADPEGWADGAMDSGGARQMPGHPGPDQGTESQGAGPASDPDSGVWPAECTACGRSVGDRPSRPILRSGMGAVLGPLADLGYGFAWRVLDAQHFGVPQRRRRVVIVGCLGDDRRPVEVLLEPEGGGGHPPTRHAPRPGIAATLTAGAHRPGGSVPGQRAEDNVSLVFEGNGGHGAVAPTLTAPASGGRRDKVPMVMNALTTRSGDSLDDQQTTQLIVSTIQAGGGKRGYRVDAEGAAGGHLIPYQKVTRPASSGHPDVWDRRDVAATLSPFDLGSDSRAVELVVCATGDRTHSLTAEGHDASEDGTGRGTPLVAFHLTQDPISGDVAPALGRKSGGQGVATETTVRRLTPRECERLQGLPDDWTATSNGKAQADSPRYQQLGNAVAAPVFEWVARRIVASERGAA